MNNIKEILCNIVMSVKKDEGYTYDELIILYRTNTKNINKRQLVQILKHKGKGVSVEVIDHLIYRLGYEMEVMIKPHYNLLNDMEVTYP